MGHGWHEAAAYAERRRAVKPGSARGTAAHIGRRARSRTSRALATTRRAWRQWFAWWSRQLLEVRGN
jgi:hypothetical protein